MAPIVLFRTKRPLPLEHRSNFIHLYWDIAWFGVLNGSAISFMAVFATRLGADGFQLGLLSAAPAVINLAATLPAGQWLQKRPISHAVFWSSVFHRAFYIAWIFLPLLLAPYLQVWALIGLVLLMSIPGTALAVGFNALFAAAVPPEWRGHVAGTRNGMLAGVFIVTSLVCGFILETLPFPLGYQVVFAIGALGAAMSSLHLYFVRPLVEPGVNGRAAQATADLARPGSVRSDVTGLRATVGLRFLARSRRRLALRPRVLGGAFGPVAAAMFIFHLAQYLAIPLFPLYWVNELGLTDANISLGNAVFYATVLVGSTQLGRLSNRFGHKQVMVLGVAGMALYPALTALTQELTLFLITSLVGGLVWSLVGGAIGNYILERIPEEERPSYLAWYNLALNAAILLGSMLGPLLANQVGLVVALLLITAVRYLSAVALWRWG